MANIPLDTFIGTNRDELLGRCRARVVRRPAPLVTEAEIDRGVPLFLDQLCEELRLELSQPHEMNLRAVHHAHDFLLQGFTVSQVVHDYRDVCQSIADFAVETGAPISTRDFRTLNRCLDDAVAGAVTEYGREERVTRDGKSYDLRHLIETAITGFEAIREGTVGAGGSTGAAVLHSLMGLRAALANGTVFSK